MLASVLTLMVLLVCEFWEDPMFDKPGNSRCLRVLNFVRTGVAVLL